MERQRRRRSGAESVKIADVAAAAGVSTATVSRSLNAPSTVGEAVRQRVEKAVADLGYIPHRAGRTLASRHSKTMGAIVPTIENAIFARHVMAFQQRLNEAGYTLLLATSEYDAEQEFRQARVLLEHGIDGLMLVGQRRDQAFYDMLKRTRVPYINTWLYRPDLEHPCCGFDHEVASREAVDHLVALGHRRIAVVTGHAAVNDRVEARLNGVRAALARHGLTLDEGLILPTFYSFQAGRSALSRLLAVDRPPTAVICGNDVLAMGILREARARSIAVPDALSVIGFGDLEIAANTEPPLTTIRSPKRRIGETAARYLIAAVGGSAEKIHFEIATQFCHRGSTGPAPVGAEPGRSPA